MGAGPRELYGAFPVRALTPFIRALFYDLITTKAPTPNTIVQAIRIPTYEFGGIQTFSLEHVVSGVWILVSLSQARKQTGGGNVTS